MQKQKIIGTFVPLSALQSNAIPSKNNGTFAVGLPFLKWLKRTHQSAWQMLPLHETQLEKGSATKHVPSPYKSYGIGLAPRYLDSKYAKQVPTVKEKEAFIKKHKAWIHDYAMFCSLRDFFETDDWRMWPKEIRNRGENAMRLWEQKLRPKIDAYIIQQWQLHQSVYALRADAKAMKIALIGDLPFYPSVQSPLVWANQSIFQMNKDGSLPFVSGIPNLEGTHFGRQVWGHPLYRWEKQQEVVSFWKLRLDYMVELFDWMRFDHIKGFFQYGVMDVHDSSHDKFYEGPGNEVLEHLVAHSHSIGLHIFVEDSGIETHTFLSIMRKLRVPGIKILRFLLKNRMQSVYSGSLKAVAYTTTHDTETLLGYLHKVKPARKELLASLTHVTYSPYDKILAARIRDELLKSPVLMVIIPIQDWLLLTERINIPGTEKEVKDPNWRFRLKMPVESFPTNING